MTDGALGAIAFIVIVMVAIYGGIKQGVASVFKEEPEKEKPTKPVKGEQLAPEGKMWVRIGKDPPFLVPTELAHPRPPAKKPRKKRRPRVHKTAP